MIELLTTDPVSLKILAAIEARLPAIQTSAGYNFDIGDNGTRLLGYSEVKDFPGLFVVEGPAARIVRTGQYELQRQYKFYAWVKSDDRRAAIHRLEQDVEKMIYVDETWGGLAELTHVLDSQTDRGVFFTENIGYLEMTAEVFYMVDRGQT